MGTRDRQSQIRTAMFAPGQVFLPRAEVADSVYGPLSSEEVLELR